MDISELLKNQYFLAITSGIGGIIATLIAQKILNKRGTFSYFVNHQRLGMSAEDPIFGKVLVSWNNTPVSNLFLSTIELKNESLKDYDNIIVRAYSSDTTLLSEQTQIVGTPNILEWSDNFKTQLHVKEGEQPTDSQWSVFNAQREYVVPIMNRGQAIKMTYLNAAKTQAGPTIWLAVTQKGVRLQFTIPQKLVWGVAQSQAALVGTVVGIVGTFPLAWQAADPLIIGFVALTYGLIAQLPGAIIVRTTRKFIELIGD